MDYYTDTLPKGTKLVLENIKKLPEIRKFYLTGGSALSLHLGHRESEDLDFFTKTPFQPQELQQKLSILGALEDVTVEENTLNLFMQGVKLQFLYYPYDLLEELMEWDGIFLSSIIDIACTKLVTISMRGSKKDFIDLYVILQKTSLEELFSKLNKKYKNTKYNEAHILKSLLYFADADAQPMPRMHMDVSWEDIKSYIAKGVKSFNF